MEYIPNILVLAPMHHPLSIAIFVAAVAISSFWYRRVGSPAGVGLYAYAVITALIVAPYLLFVAFVFYSAPVLGSFSYGVGALALSVLMTPLAVGWLAGLVMGSLLRLARRGREQS